MNLLADQQDHNRVAISKKLNITPTVVCKIIETLKRYGIKIHSMKEKGYILREPCVLLDPEKIKRGIRFNNIELEFFESIGSTNDYLKTKKNDQPIHICLSEMQTKGKGRHNRYWYSPFGHNLYLSLRYLFEDDIRELTALSLVAGLAIRKTLELLYKLNPALTMKWPNDLMFENKKLAGTLIEIQTRMPESYQVIIGIGININLLHDKQNAITQPWTSVRKITGDYIDRNILTIKLINTFMDYIQCFKKHGFIVYLDEWERHDGLFNKSETRIAG